MSIPGLLLISALATAAPEPSADVEVEAWAKLGAPWPVQWMTGRDEVDRFRVRGGQGPRRFVLVAPDGTRSVRELVGLSGEPDTKVSWWDHDVAVVLEHPHLPRVDENWPIDPHLLRVGRCEVDTPCRWFEMRVASNARGSWEPLPVSGHATLVLGVRTAYLVDLDTGAAVRRRDWHPRQGREGPWDVVVADGGGWAVYPWRRGHHLTVVSFDGQTFHRLVAPDAENDEVARLGLPVVFRIGRPSVPLPAVEERIFLVASTLVGGAADDRVTHVALVSIGAVSTVYAANDVAAVGTVEGRVVLWRDGALWTLGPPPEVALQQGQVLELKRWCDVDEAPPAPTRYEVNRIGRDASGRWWVEYEKAPGRQDFAIHALQTSGCASPPP